MATTNTAPKIKQGASVKYINKRGEVVYGVVKGGELPLANGIWRNVKVEGQKEFAKLRPSQLTLA